MDTAVVFAPYQRSYSTTFNCNRKYHGKSKAICNVCQLRCLMTSHQPTTMYKCNDIYSNCSLFMMLLTSLTLPILLPACIARYTVTSDVFAACSVVLAHLFISTVLCHFQNKMMFESWEGLMQGRKGLFHPDVQLYSFNGKNIMSDPTW